MGVSLDGSFGSLDGFGKGKGQFAAGGVEVAAAVEELFRHLVAGKIVYAAQANAHHVALRVLAQGNAEAHALYLQRHVHQSLGVAPNEVEARHFAAREGED